MRKSKKIWYWAPRIICILAILFVSLFALDAFDPKLNFWNQIVGFLIHMIPSFMLMGILWLAWNNEYLGGIILVIVGLFFSIVVFRLNYRMNQSFWNSLGIVAAITFPFIVAGVLFILNHFQNKTLSKH